VVGLSGGGVDSGWVPGIDGVGRRLIDAAAGRTWRKPLSRATAARRCFESGWPALAGPRRGLESNNTPAAGTLWWAGVPAGRMQRHITIASHPPPTAANGHYAALAISAIEPKARGSELQQPVGMVFGSSPVVSPIPLAAAGRGAEQNSQRFGARMHGRMALIKWSLPPGPPVKSPAPLPGEACLLIRASGWQRAPGPGFAH